MTWRNRLAAFGEQLKHIKPPKIENKFSVGNILSILSSVSAVIVFFSDLRSDVNVVEVKVDDTNLRVEYVRQDVIEMQRRVEYLERRERGEQLEEQLEGNPPLFQPFWVSPPSVDYLWPASSNSCEVAP